ncbi:MAG: LptF/LptG family permease, partial [bacterium]
MSGLFTRYVVREHIGPFFFGLCVIMLLFILNLLFRDLAKFLSKGIAFTVILEFLYLNLAWMVALAVPMAVLTSTLMAFGRLSADNEITAIKASGVSFYQILPSVLVVSALLAGGLIWFNNHVLPDFNHRARLLTIDIARKRPMINLEPGVYYTDIPDYNILVQKIREAHSISYVENVLIDDQSDPSANTTIRADRGEIMMHQKSGLLEITLYNGEMQTVNVNEPESLSRS